MVGFSGRGLGNSGAGIVEVFDPGSRFARVVRAA